MSLCHLSLVISRCQFACGQVAVVVVPPVGVAKLTVSAIDALRLIRQAGLQFVVITETGKHVEVGEDSKGVVFYDNLSIEGFRGFAYQVEGFAIGSRKLVVGSGDAVGKIVMAREFALEFLELLVKQKTTKVVIGCMLIAEGIGCEKKLHVTASGMDALATKGAQMKADVLSGETLEGGSVGHVKKST